MADYRSEVNAAVLKRLYALARDLMDIPDTDSIPVLIGPAMHDLTACDGALLLVTAKNHESITEFDHRGDILPAGKEQALLNCAHQVMNRQKPLFLNTKARRSFNARSLAAVGITRLLAVPFPATRPVGALTVFWNGSAHQRFTNPRSILRRIAELAGLAMVNIVLKQEMEGTISTLVQKIAESADEHAREISRRDQVEKEIRSISVTDVLTGMQNRRGFFMQAEQSFKMAQRQGLASALIFVDIDRLKTINDSLGHEMGDHLIQDSAQVLNDSFRASDVVARMGGDEFAAFTVDASHPEAILARIQNKIERFNQQADRPYEISFSTGIVQCDPSSHLTLGDYLAMADEKMYVQKRGKRA